MMRRPKKNMIHKIALQEILVQKRRNIMIIIAIFLAAFLLSLCGAMVCAIYHSQKNLSHDTFEILFHNMSKQKIETLKKYPDVERVAIINHLIEEVNEDNVSISIDYYDENTYYISRNQYRLLDGRLPESGNEIVASEGYLKKYAPDCAIDDELHLQVGQEQVTFKLNGIVSYTTADESEYSFYITKDFLEGSPYYNPSSSTAYVHFKNADAVSNEELKERGVQIAHDLDTTYDYSALYFNNSKEVSMGTVVLFFCITMIVLFAGVVVIQSVFYISINENIRSYGQLCVVGTTKKQLKDIIKLENVILVLCGAPAGILAGDLIGTGLGSSRITDGFDFISIFSISVLVFLICAGMVMFATAKPVKFITNLSPIEAQKYVGYQNNSAKKRKSYKKMSPFWLTIMNISRDKKKTVRTMISLVFSGVLMLVAASMEVSFSAEQNVRTKMFKNGGSYRIYVNDPEQILKDNPLTKELEQKIISASGSNQVLPIRESAGECDLKAEGLSVEGLCDIISNRGAYEGREDFISRYLVQGNLPQDKNEVLLVDIVQEIRPVSVGDHATLKLGKNKTDVVIAGFFDAAYVGTSDGFKSEDGANVMITKDLAQEMFPETENFEYSWEIITAEDSKEEMQKKLTDLVYDKNISICSFKTEVSYLQAQMNLIWGGVQMISLFILLFAVINLINMLLSNFNSRRWELSVMRSIGLTQKQLNFMFLMESGIYVVISVGITMIAGIPISVFVCKYFGAFIGMEEMAYKFPSIQVLIYGLLLFILQCIFSKLFVKNMNRHTISEQLRSVE